MQVNGDVREVTTVKLMMAIDQLAGHYVATHGQVFDRFDEAPQVSALEQAARELTASLKELAELQGKVDAQRRYLEETFGVEELRQALTNN